MANFLWDVLVSAFIRVSIKNRIRKETKKSKNKRHKQGIIRKMSEGHISVYSDDANKVHYEMPAEFFQNFLGEQLKYSAGHYESEAIMISDISRRISRAERDMFDLCIERAGIKNGQTVLEIGCGFGGWLFYVASKFPKCKIVGLTNSEVQKKFLDKEKKQRKAKNIQIIKADINDFSTTLSPSLSRIKGIRFDRIIAIEMFAHAQNYQELLFRIAGWLKNQDSRLFVQMSAHATHTYFFDKGGLIGSNWIARKFFRGGIMPCYDIFTDFARDMKVVTSWKVRGGNYGKTAADWLSRFEKNGREVRKTLQKKVFPPFSPFPSFPLFSWALAHYEYFTWRLFFMGIRELFDYNDGNEWLTGHYLLKKTKVTSKTKITGKAKVKGKSKVTTQRKKTVTKRTKPKLAHLSRR